MEIEPESLELENFKTHQYSYIDFTKFDSALILGAKEDNEAVSNAVGKTTILKAIEYVWYGEYSTKTIDKVIRRGSDKAKVTFILKAILPNDISRYKMQRSRSRKNKSSEILLFKDVNGKFEPIDGVRASETDKEILKIFKINHTAFKNAVIFSQGDLSGLANAKDSKSRFALLEEILNLLEYSKLEKIIKTNHIPSFNKEIGILQSQINILGDPAKDIKDLQKQISNDEEIIKEGQFLKEKNDQIIQQHQDKISILEKSNTGDQDKESLNKINQVEKNIDLCKNTIVSLNKELNKKESTLKDYNDSISINSTKKTNLQNEYNDLILLKLEDKSDLIKELTLLHQQEIKSSEKIAILNSQISKLTHQLPKERVCQECKQEITEDYKQKYKKLQDLEKQQCLNDLKTEKEALDKIKSQKDKTNLSIQKIDNHQNKLSKINFSINGVTNEDSKLKALQKQVLESIDEIKSKIGSQNASLDLFKTEHNQLIALIKQSSDSSSALKELSELKQNLISLNKASDTCKLSIDNHIISLAIYKDRLLNKKKDLDTLAKLKEALEKSEYRLKIAQESSLGFGQMIPKAIIYGMLDELQQQVSFWIEKINPDIKINFKYDKKDKNSEDLFDISYTLDGIEDFDYEDLSGAQEFMVNLAFKLAISKTIQENLNICIKLFAFDELDERLDASASESFYQIIKELEKQHKILIISHREDLKSKFSHVIKVVKNDKDKSSQASLAY